MRTSRWLAMAGAAVAAAALTGCILPPPHDHGRDGGRGDGRYDHRGDRDGDGRWDVKLTDTDGDGSADAASPLTPKT